MRTIETRTTEGNRLVKIYNIDDFPYPWNKVGFEHKVYKGRGEHKRRYYNISAAFDIETTTIVDRTKSTPDHEHHMGFMYIWQFCLKDKVCMGRTWAEFQTFVSRLEKSLGLNDDLKLCVYVHYLPFEFQFFRDFFDIKKVFAKDARDIVVCDIGPIEFRCSYALSNMSLDKFCKNSRQCAYQKLDGEEFNYDKIRLPNTELPDEELAYCYNDVRGLCQCIDTMLEDDTIGSIPLTSTGFLRRECRKAVLENPKNKKEVERCSLKPSMYLLCKTAARGGNTHANAIYTSSIITDVKSKDLKSSYPAVMMCCDFPVTGFIKVEPTMENLDNYLEDKACLIDVTFHNIRMTSCQLIPYISVSKCTGYKNIRSDNGRVLSADNISCVITDIDLKIIMKMYDIKGGIEIRNLYIAEYGKLNKEFRSLLMDYFTKKCELENGDPYLYAKFKNRVNAFFGMMLTDICHPEVKYVPNCEKPWQQGEINAKEMLNTYYNSRNSFLTYQHGIWVTAHARRRLQEGLDLVDSDVVYVDTDSIKYVEEHERDFDKLNETWLNICDNNDIKPYVDIDGKRTYLGTWEDDGHYSQFVTLGAKKYAYIKAGDKEEKLHITVAGLAKENGAKYLEKCEGGIKGFKIGTIVPAERTICEIDKDSGEEKIIKVGSGRTAATYNDETEIKTMVIDGCEIVYGSNIGIVKTTYKFGVTDEYFDYYNSIQ